MKLEEIKTAIECHHKFMEMWIKLRAMENTFYTQERRGKDEEIEQ